MPGHMNTKANRSSDQYMLRMPDGLRDRIKSHARINARSMNTEIIMALEAAFPVPVAPESINEALLVAARSILTDWTRTLEAIGQSADENPRVRVLRDAVDRAEAKQ